MVQSTHFHLPQTVVDWWSLRQPWWIWHVANFKQANKGGFWVILLLSIFQSYKMTSLHVLKCSQARILCKTGLYFHVMYCLERPNRYQSHWYVSVASLPHPARQRARLWLQGWFHLCWLCTIGIDFVNKWHQVVLHSGTYLYSAI